MYLVVGLGNPDRQYADTFHNVGFLVADRLARLLGASFDKGECRAICAHARLCGEKVIVAKPITYMNLSGESLKELVKKYKIEREKCVVVYDDADMPLGAIRLRKSGSGGSHNGMKNIIENMRTEDIFRVRLGIGRPQNDRMELKDYVLGKINDGQRTLLEPALENAAQALKMFVSGADADAVMRTFNKREKKTPVSQTDAEQTE